MSQGLEGQNSRPARQRSATDWRLGAFAGAALGGVFWACAALATIGSPGSQAQHNEVIPQRLVLIAACSVILLVVGAGLLRVRGRIGRALGLALILCPLTGWLIVASLALQRAAGWI